MTFVRLLLATAVVAGAAACGDDTPTNPTPQPTPRPTVTEEFTGTLTVNGARTHTFNTGGSGQITLTLTELTPNSEVEIGVSLGTWNGNSCAIVIAKDSATQSAAVIGSAAAAGNFCARVYDAGELRSTTDYRITVVHF